MIINRDKYLNKIIDKLGNGSIKVIVGPRRCGKSFLLFTLLRNYLIEQNVEDNHIIGINLELSFNRKYWDPENLEEYFTQRIVNDGKTNYLLIDEIQYVKPKKIPYSDDQQLTFYEVIMGLNSLPNVEIFVTGSNSYMLSTDIFTQFRGKGDLIQMHPLSFLEFKNTQSSLPIESVYQIYSNYGGLPQCANLTNIPDKIDFLKNIFKTVYQPDIIERYSLKGDTNIKSVIEVLSSSVGSLVNPTKIANTIKTKLKDNISTPTVRAYLEYLAESLLVKKALRYDVKGRNYIESTSKYYFEDIGIKNAVTDFREVNDSPHLMENIIFNELIANGYSIDVGEIETNELNASGTYTRKKIEVDFIATKDSQKLYIQSVYDLHSESKKETEKLPLLRIDDGFPKIIIARNLTSNLYDNDGIFYIDLYDFLLDPNIFDDSKLYRLLPR